MVLRVIKYSPYLLHICERALPVITPASVLPFPCQEDYYVVQGNVSKSILFLIVQLITICTVSFFIPILFVSFQCTVSASQSSFPKIPTQ